MGITGKRVHQEQHVEPLIAEILGDGQCGFAPLETHQRRSIGGSCHHHGAGTPLLTQDILDELLHLAAPFADEPYHDHIGYRAAGHHAEQHGFTNAGASKQPHPLALTDGQHRIDGTHPDIHRLMNGATRKRIDAVLGKLHRLGGENGTETIQRLTDTVDHPAEKIHADRNTMLFGDGHHPGTGNDPLELLARHQIEAIAREADYFSLQRPIKGIDTAERADGGTATDGFEGQPHHPGQFAGNRWFGGAIAHLVPLQPVK